MYENLLAVHFLYYFGESALKGGACIYLGNDECLDLCKQYHQEIFSLTHLFAKPL